MPEIPSSLSLSLAGQTALAYTYNIPSGTAARTKASGRDFIKIFSQLQLSPKAPHSFAHHAYIRSQPRPFKREPEKYIYTFSLALSLLYTVPGKRKRRERGPNARFARQVQHARKVHNDAGGGCARTARERESEVITIYVRSLLSFCADCARPFLSLCFLFLAPRARALRGGERAGGWAESREGRGYGENVWLNEAEIIAVGFRTGELV